MTTSPPGHGSSGKRGVNGVDPADHPADAVERLREVIAEMETLANAAARMSDDLPWIADARQRRAVGRMQGIVFMIADRAEAALDEADMMVRATGRGGCRTRGVPRG